MTDVKNFFKKDWYFGTEATQDLLDVRKFVGANEVNIFDPKYYMNQNLQTPSADQTFLQIAIGAQMMVPLPEAGGMVLTFSPTGALGHIDSILIQMGVSFAGATATPSPFWPYLLWQSFKLYMNNVLLYDTIDMLYLVLYMFMKMRYRVRASILKYAEASPVPFDGSDHLMVLPTPWCPIMNGVYSAPLPIRMLNDLQLTFQLTSRPYAQWLNTFTTGVTVLTVTTQIQARCIIFNDTFPHSDEWVIAFENGIKTRTLNYPVPTANTDVTFKVTGMASRRLKGIFFAFNSTADTTAGAINLFKGGMPSSFSYNPNGGTGFSLNKPSLVALMMIMSWLQLDYYLSSDTIANWSNSLFFSFGGRYQVDALYGSNFYKSDQDPTSWVLQYPTTGVVNMLGICYQIIALKYTGRVGEPTSADIVFKYGADAGNGSGN